MVNYFEKKNSLNDYLIKMADDYYKTLEELLVIIINETGSKYFRNLLKSHMINHIETKPATTKGQLKREIVMLKLVMNKNNSRALFDSYVLTLKKILKMYKRLVKCLESD